MINSKMMVTEEVKNLILTMRDLRFGEIFGADPKTTGPSKELLVSRNELDLIAILEDIGSLDIITVHQGNPVLAEVDTKINGLRCRKKYKFPTE